MAEQAEKSWQRLKQAAALQTQKLKVDEFAGQQAAAAYVNV